MEYTKELHEQIERSLPSEQTWILLSEIKRLQSLTQWVRVEDRLPEVKKNTLFLCQFRDFQNNWKIDTRTFWADSKSFSGSCKVEYWTPLPEGVK
jgi:hypothetical protein